MRPGEDRLRQHDLVDADLEVPNLVDVGRPNRGVKEELVCTLTAIQDVVAKAAVKVIVAAASVKYVLPFGAKEFPPAW